MIRLINTFPVNVLIGEGSILYWLQLVVRGSKLIRKEKLTHVYSSYRPFADHYATWILKKLHPHIIWIADFRDLIVDPNTSHQFFPGWHDRFYRSFFQSADVITTVSEGLAERLKSYNANVRVLRNGVSSDYTPPPPENTAKFHIVYTGSMFMEQRNEAALFSAIRNLMDEGKIDPSKFQIDYAGKDGAWWEETARHFHLDSVLKNHGLISPQEVRLLQRKAGINVMLTISNPEVTGVITGKWIEYMEAGSPVLAITSGQKDVEISGLLRELNGGACFADDDMTGIKVFIADEYALWVYSGMNRRVVDAGVLRTEFGMVGLAGVLFAPKSPKGDLHSF